MKKRNLLFFAALLAIAISMVVGIHAFAAENTSEKVPKIVSKNISYSSNLHIYYAIPADTVAEGAEIKLNMYTQDPATTSENPHVITECELKTISAITGTDEDYYVFRSYGVPAKSIANVCYAQPVVYFADGSEIVGDTVKYSVAEYCFERLFNDGYIFMEEDDGTDYLRRNLYETLLEYSHYAQKVLDTEEEQTQIDSLAYVAVINGATQNGISSGFVTAGDKITVSYDGTGVPNGYYFGGWDITNFTAGGERTTVSYSSETIDVTIGLGGTTIVARFVEDPAAARAEEIARQEALDAVDVQNQWNALENAFAAKYDAATAAELVDSMKLVYSMYDDSMVTWIASLYSKGWNDPEGGNYRGGFYASTAGRDAVGYGPDLQCSVQLLRMMVSSGMMDSWHDIPEWMQHELVYFSKSLQKSDGYFYHPQWENPGTSRLGRDLGWGTELQTVFGEKPQYKTASNSGGGLSAEEYLAKVTGGTAALNTKSSLTTSLSSASAVSAVSKVVLTANVTTFADYLVDHKTFINYLHTSVDLRNLPYQAGNNLNANYSQVATYSATKGTYTYASSDPSEYEIYDGMTMKEILLRYLNDNINPKTGLFGGWNAETGAWSDEVLFSYTNGFFKVISIYNNWQAPYGGDVYPSAASLAAKGLMSVLLGNQSSTGNAANVYNVWSAICSIKNNVRNHNQDNADAVIETIDGTLATDGAFALVNTFNKMKGYKKSDGGFSHSYFTGVTTHQGCPVSPSGANVSDVDATCISTTGLVKNIFGAFDMTSYQVDIFTESDFMRWVDYVEAAEPIRKGDITEAKYSFANAQIPEEITVTGGRLILVKHNDSNALKFGGSASDVMTVQRHSVTNVGSAVRFRADMSYVTDGSYTLNFRTQTGIAVSLTLTVTGGRLTVTDNISGDNLAAEISDTFKLSIEIAPVYDAEANAYNTTAKLFVDGVDLGAIVNYRLAQGYTGITRVTDVKTVDLVQNGVGEIILDNLSFVIAPMSANYFSDFENTELYSDTALTFSDGGFKIEFTEQTNADGIIDVKSEQAGSAVNKYLNFWKKKGGGTNDENTQSLMHFCRSDGSSDTVIFETKLRFHHTSSSGGLKLNLRGSDTEPWRIYIDADDKTVRFYGIQASSAYESELLSNYGITEGSWFTLKVEITTNGASRSMSATTYLNGISAFEQTLPAISYSDARYIVDFGIVPDRAWIGTVDVDDISFTDGEKMSEIEVDQDIPEEDGECLAHSPGNEVVENVTAATCEETGSYDRVVYCTSCSEELSRTKVTVPKLSHSFASGIAGECLTCHNIFTADGYVDFDDMAAGEWTAPGTGSVLAGVGSQTDSDHTFTIVESESGTKYLSLNKVGRKVSGSDQAMAWVLLQMNSTVAQGSDIWFETKMSFNQTNGSSVAIRLYDGRTAASANSGGTEVGKSNRMSIKLVNGNVTIGGTSTGAAAGEWFTFRIVISGETVTAYVVAEDGTTTTLATFTDASASNIDGVQFTCNSADYAVFNFEHVYFGGTPVYSSGTDAPVQGG